MSDLTMGREIGYAFLVVIAIGVVGGAALGLLSPDMAARKKEKEFQRLYNNFVVDHSHEVWHKDSVRYWYLVNRDVDSIVAELKK